MDLALNNLQWLMCHKTKQNKTKPYLTMRSLTSRNTCKRYLYPDGESPVLKI